VISLFRPFVHLCMFRIGPQSLPVSSFLLGLVLCAHTLMNIFGFMFLMLGPDAVFAGIVGTMLLCSLTYAVLTVQRRQARLVQTLTALAGTITILNLVGLPFASWLKSTYDAGLNTGAPMFIVMILTGWHLTVQAHILRHAMSTPLMVGLTVSLFFFVISVTVLQSLFPPVLA
jgi:hypothetical protein